MKDRAMFYRLLPGMLAVWRLTHLLGYEDGPNDFILKARQRAADGFLGRLFGCFYCLSLWVAIPVTLLVSKSWRERALIWPGLSAGAILLEHLIEATGQAPAAPYIEDEET
jgi:hypothetical protein